MSTAADTRSSNSRVQLVHCKWLIDFPRNLCGTGRCFFEPSFPLLVCHSYELLEQLLDQFLQVSTGRDWRHWSFFLTSPVSVKYRASALERHRLAFYGFLVLSHVKQVAQWFFVSGSGSTASLHFSGTSRVQQPKKNRFNFEIHFMCEFRLCFPWFFCASFHNISVIEDFLDFICNRFWSPHFSIVSLNFCRVHCIIDNSVPWISWARS